jgi:hypothetical protein
MARNLSNRNWESTLLHHPYSTWRTRTRNKANRRTMMRNDSWKCVTLWATGEWWQGTVTSIRWSRRCSKRFIRIILLRFDWKLGSCMPCGTPKRVCMMRRSLWNGLIIRWTRSYWRKCCFITNLMGIAEKRDWWWGDRENGAFFDYFVFIFLFYFISFISIG